MVRNPSDVSDGELPIPDREAQTPLEEYVQTRVDKLCDAIKATDWGDVRSFGLIASDLTIEMLERAARRPPVRWVP